MGGNFIGLWRLRVPLYFSNTRSRILSKWQSLQKKRAVVVDLMLTMTSSMKWLLGKPVVNLTWLINISEEGKEVGELCSTAMWI